MISYVMMVGTLIKGKGKFVPVHIIKSHKESRSIVPPIPNLGTR
jgi:hypothetical protein